MPIRKQLFFSNILMIIFAVASLLLSIFLIGAVLRVFYNTEWQDMKNIDERVYEVMTIIKDADLAAAPQENMEDKIKQLAEECGEQEYALHVTRDGDPFFSNMNDTEQNALNSLDSSRLETSSGVPRVAQSKNRTVIYDSCETDGSRYEILAVGKNSSLRVSRRELIEMAAATGGILVLMAVIVTLLLSRYFSWKLIDRFMVPVQKLIDGAERIREGNLDEMIYYSGNNEFALVCSAFNDMQASLKQEIEKNQVYEKSRIEMIAGISHDLRTPLTSVKGYIKGMMDGIANTPEKQRQYLITAYEKAGEMDRLLQQLFLFSKLETGNVPLALQRIHISEYIRQYLEKHRKEFEERGAELTFQSYYEDGIVEIDVDQMDRVLNNIIDNSIKYKEKETTKISIFVYEAWDEVMISVLDNGTGVESGSLPYIFNSYYRTESNKKEKPDGNGLGLSIVKYIVEAHGGRLLARNRGGLEILIYLKDKKKDETA